MNISFAQVVFPIPVDRLFTYSIPEKFINTAKVGSRIIAPFGQKLLVGFIVERNETAETAEGKIKEIAEVLEPNPVFDPELLSLTKWMANYYICSWGEALRTALPAALDETPKLERVVEISDMNLAKEMIEVLRVKAPQQSRCLQILVENNGSLVTQRLIKGYKIGVQSIQALQKKGIITTSQRETFRDPFRDIPVETPDIVLLTPDQKEALLIISNLVDAERFRTVLLHGVTGSGKTEVYIRTISQVVRADKTALVLVPEISLTPQTVRRFRSHFGDQVAVLHSALSDGERRDTWYEIFEGRKRIVVGARSAVFAPLRRLGLIIVDEEHESTYKQFDAEPRYNARDVAVMRAKISDAVVLLGSATPSLESYQNAKSNKFTLIELPIRIEDRPMPEVTIVDMRKEKAEGNWSIFSRLLESEVENRLKRNEQVILFQNRRGFAPFIQCRDCGFVPRCKHCQVTLTYHSVDRRLRCHYCNYSTAAPSFCPKCKGTDVKFSGIGTQRVEEYITNRFADARIIRMDVDTTGHKGAHHNFLERFRKGEADILLGTQMVAKGLDFPRVTLVGVISADVGLHLPDFRAAERTFQILTQVAGRAGRADLSGTVVVQTYLPENEAIRYAQNHNYGAFAEKELANREELDYPPFGRLILLLFRGRSKEDVIAVANQYATCLGHLLGNESDLQILGPAEAPLGRLKSEWRWQIILKGKTSKTLHDAVRKVSEECWKMAKSYKIKVNVDVDPIGML